MKLKIQKKIDSNTFVLCLKDNDLSPKTYFNVLFSQLHYIDKIKYKVKEVTNTVSNGCIEIKVDKF